MTSGTIGDLGTFPVSTSPVSNRLYKTWVGSDGKTEVYAGGKRVKWNNLTTTAYTRQVTKTNWHGRRNNGTTFSVSLTFPKTPGMSHALTSKESADLLSKLISKVKGHQFNLPVNLGQLGQLATMVTGTLGSLGNAIGHVKRGNLGFALRALGVAPRGRRNFRESTVQGRWLEIQYGWLPAVSDAHEAMKAFHEISRGPRRTLFTKSFKRMVVDTGGTFTNGVSYSSAGHVGRKLMYEMYEEMSFPRQLGLADPLSLAWELLPYSFVVDWFIPIGTYLSNLNQAPSLKGRFLTIDRIKYEKQHVSWVDHPADGALNYKSGISYPDIYWSATKLTRVLSSEIAVPRPSFDYRGIFHGKRVVNAIALAAQRFR